MSPQLEAHAQAMRMCREILARNSKSFAFAARFLTPEGRDQSAAVYAYCRHVDDAIDGAPVNEQPGALGALERELDLLYGAIDLPMPSPTLRAFRAAAALCALPRCYPRELIEGMRMDVLGTRYDTLADLLLYCHRAAGVVGLMMCHVFGVTRDDALRSAACLGIAMQLTNVCRDVQEDWRLGRLYLPRQLLLAHGARELPDVIAGPFPADEPTLRAMALTMQALLREADRYYAAAEPGISALPFRAGLAVRCASRLYRAIGVRVAAWEHDPRRGRAVVPTREKLALGLRAFGAHLAALPDFLRERWAHGWRARTPGRALHFTEGWLSSSD